MGYFDTERGIQEYTEMAKGYDGAELIDLLHGHLSAGSTVLELGMGPGVDLDLLSRTYVATGSDYSQLFLDHYRSQHPDADLIRLDAASLDTDRCFDCIYSNKVLHHLKRREMRASLMAQCGLLNTDGLALHSFWWGEKEDEFMEGLRFVYYTEETLADAIADSGFETLVQRRYSEMEHDDSILVLLRKLDPTHVARSNRG